MDSLYSVFILPYLGRTISLNNSNCFALYQNPRNSQRRWGMVLGVMVKLGVTLRSRLMFYKSVVQAVLFYGSEIWLITDSMMKVLEGFQHCIARRITGKTERRVREERWECPLL